MMTSTGFTTKESELILRHPLRRKISMFLILFGVFSLAVLISSISSMLKESFNVLQLIIITLGLAFILVSVKTKKIKRILTQNLYRRLEQEFETHELPIAEVLYTDEDDLVTQIQVTEQSEWIGRRATELFVQGGDVILLLIQRAHHKIRRQCMKLTIQEGDILLVYGSKTEIETKFKPEMKRSKKHMEDENNVVDLTI
jgi:hypothetical protein